MSAFGENLTLSHIAELLSLTHSGLSTSGRSIRCGYNATPGSIALRIRLRFTCGTHPSRIQAQASSLAYQLPLNGTSRSLRRGERAAMMLSAGVALAIHQLSFHPV